MKTPISKSIIYCANCSPWDTFEAHEECDETYSIDTWENINCHCIGDDGSNSECMKLREILSAYILVGSEMQTDVFEYECRNIDDYIEEYWEDPDECDYSKRIHVNIRKHDEIIITYVYDYDYKMKRMLGNIDDLDIVQELNMYEEYLLEQHLQSIKGS